MLALTCLRRYFRSRIDHIIDLSHSLAVLALRMPWQAFEERVAQAFSPKGRAGVATQAFVKEGNDLNPKSERYAHARQFRRMRCAIKRKRTYVELLVQPRTGQLT